MSLFSITYSSTRLGEFVVNDIVDLAERAAAYNTACDITGYLCHSDDHFLQTIEGDYEEVNRVYHTRIVTARSHRDLRLLHVQTLNSRRFAFWAMGFANVSPADRQLLLQFFPKGVMDPDSISGTGAVDFLQALSHAPDTFHLR
jgi:hypothetical protein